MKILKSKKTMKELFNTFIKKGEKELINEFEDEEIMKDLELKKRVKSVF